jgi:outer membrane protein assembly factor BamB
MKSTPSFPPHRRVSRRHFLAGTTAGVAGSLLSPTIGLAGGAQGRGGRGQDPGPALPPIHPPPAQFPGTGRYLYVTNDRGRRIDVFSNTTGEHSLLWSFPYADPGGRVGGVCADHATQRIFATQLSDGTVAAYDMLTGKIIWRVNTVEKYGLRQPDRLTITVDGKALFVPMNFSRETSGYGGWQNHVFLVLDAATGQKISEIARPGRPHNSWSGEAGQYMYLGGRSDQTLVVADQKTYNVVKTIGPFDWPIRMFVTDPRESFFYTVLTRTVGFGVADIRAGKVLPDVLVQVPKTRTKYWTASSAGGGAGSLPHGDNPWSHGLGMRPGGSEEVWVLNDEWGYLHVFDTKANPSRPRFKGHVELFDEIDAPWNADSGLRWVAFSIDGKYCYPSDGSVVDCETGKKTAMKISASEKLLEVEFRSGKAVRNTGQQGGVYGKG